MALAHPAELGVNFGHIKSKTWTVLNPLRKPDPHIMDDADLAGPMLFSFCFGMFLLLVSLVVLLSSPESVHAELPS